MLECVQLPGHVTRAIVLSGQQNPVGTQQLRQLNSCANENIDRQGWMYSNSITMYVTVTASHQYQYLSRYIIDII